MLSGWVFATPFKIVELSLKGLSSPREVPYGLNRDDVAGEYPWADHAATSGFSAYIEVEKGAPRGSRLEVWALCSDGRSLRLFTIRSRTGRDALQTSRALISTAFWRAVMTRVKSAWRDRADQSDALAKPNTGSDAAGVVLKQFLMTGASLHLPQASVPVVSVVIVVWNQAALTLKCLRALAEHHDVPLEVIVVDNHSNDETPELLRRVNGVRVQSNAANLGFIAAANLGAQVARGAFLLFLNNDAEVLPGCMRSLLETISESTSIGAVGGKLVFPDGRLQEAGSTIWSDGSCEGYGRGGDPSSPQYDFVRDVDFCSGALLLTRRDAFRAIGGFDDRYRPAYYEDADYCVRLWKQGCRVVFQPAAVAIHVEFGSALSREQSISLQTERRKIFVNQHQDWLASQPSRDDAVQAGPWHPHGQRTALVIDDVLPNARLGAGFGRAAALLRSLGDLGYRVTSYPTSSDGLLGPRRDALQTIEVAPGGVAGLQSFFRSRHPFDVVIVSRPHNMRYLKSAVGSDLTAIQSPVVYDAEAIYALREIGHRATMGRPLPDDEAQSIIRQEVGLTRGCRAVLSVSRLEQQLFAEAGVRGTYVLGHAVRPQPTASPFEARSGVLFVGAFAAQSPNEDAVLFLLNEIVPALNHTNSAGVHIFVAGSSIPARLADRSSSNVSWHSDVKDLTSFYNRARVFVAPTRYAAGIPLKVLEAAANGVPVVCTPLLAHQLDWQPGIDLVTAEGPGDFAAAIDRVHSDGRHWDRLRRAALRRVSQEYDPSHFTEGLSRVLNGLGTAASLVDSIPKSDR